jgi:putative copper export protein
VISLATWIVWAHLLAATVWVGGAAMVLVAVLPAAEDARAVGRRAHFVTSRAMEVLILTGLLNVLMTGMQSNFALSRGFLAMLSLKMALLVVMAAAQVWMGVAWRREDGSPMDGRRRARIGLSIQCVLGAVAFLLGLGLHAV